MSAGDISVIVEEPAWKKSGVALARMKSAARLAAAAPSAASRSFSPARPVAEEKASQLTILLTNDARLQALNVQFRGKDGPTNVLSFPAEGVDGYLGDIAIAFGVTSRESAASGIGLEAHALHLAVHGVLHLLGYDHIGSREARVMERLEITILDELGISNPYTAVMRHES